jgi:hypothetical protein
MKPAPALQNLLFDTLFSKNVVDYRRKICLTYRQRCRGSFKFIYLYKEVTVNMITNVSYLENLWSSDGQVSGSASYPLISAIPGRRVAPWGMKTWITAAPTLAPIALAVCILALCSPSYRWYGVVAAPWLPPTISIQNPHPAPPPNDEKPAVSLVNGTEIKSRLRLDGHGELTIKNGTSFDAIVNLVEPRTRSVVRSLYVQSGKNFVEKNIAPGPYQIYFSTGKDWDSKTRSFQDDALYGRFETQIEFYEREDPLTGKMEFRGYAVTLQYVEGGDVACLPVDKQTFQEMMMDRPSDSAHLE